MRVFVGGVSSENAHGGCVESFLNIRLRPGDERKYQWRTRGDIARTELCDHFMSHKEFGAFFLADVDMLFHEDVLERLRSHDLDIVSGHYFRRRFNPMISIAELGEWPYEPLWDIPDDGLIEVSTSGFGCLLVKREVLEGVQKSLGPKEPILGMGPLPELTNGDQGPFGADFCFSDRARKLGYKHWVDCNPVAEARHAATVFLDRELYKKVRGWQSEKAAEHWKKIWLLNLEARGMDGKAADARIKQLELVRKKNADDLRELEDQASVLRNRLMVIDGQIAEREIDKQLAPPEPKTLVASDSPAPNFFDKLPVFANEAEARAAMAKRGKGPQGESEQEGERLREPVIKDTAKGFLEALDGPAA
jgi:hypothetical protein